MRQNHHGGVNRVRPVNSDMTDDQGYYEFAALAPGDYFVSAGCKALVCRPQYFLCSAKGKSRSVYRCTFVFGCGLSHHLLQRSNRQPGRFTDYRSRRRRMSGRYPSQPCARTASGFSRSGRPRARNLYSRQLMKHAFDAFESPVGDGMQEISRGVYEITGVPAGKYTVQMRGPQNGQCRKPLR